MLDRVKGKFEYKNPEILSVTMRLQPSDDKAFRFSDPPLSGVELFANKGQLGTFIPYVLLSGSIMGMFTISSEEQCINVSRLLKGDEGVPNVGQDQPAVLNVKKCECLPKKTIDTDLFILTGASDDELRGYGNLKTPSEYHENFVWAIKFGATTGQISDAHQDAIDAAILLPSLKFIRQCSQRHRFASSRLLQLN